MEIKGYLINVGIDGSMFSFCTEKKQSARHSIIP